MQRSFMPVVGEENKSKMTGRIEFSDSCSSSINGTSIIPAVINGNGNLVEGSMEVSIDLQCLGEETPLLTEIGLTFKPGHIYYGDGYKGDDILVEILGFRAETPSIFFRKSRRTVNDCTPGGKAGKDKRG